MGKRNPSKSKEKKQKRKEERERLAASLETIKRAYDNVNWFFQELKMFHTFEKNGVTATVGLYPVKELPEEDQKWAFELMKTSVKEFYIAGGWGWKDREKWEELTHETAYFLLAKEKDTKKSLGFINFRFDLDEGVEVAYCYEIHVTPDVRRKRLGKFLMQILELLALKSKMKKVVLTAFKENEASRNFFIKTMNYQQDETSPDICDPLNSGLYSYVILSKSLIKQS